jgi:ParB-like chromosome segregation protein Spo0J
MATFEAWQVDATRGERMTIEELTSQLVASVAALPEDERIEALNAVRRALHEISPMRHHPVDFVAWERAELVRGNTYNPNTVAPPEMKLLAHSVEANGFTMPIVAHESDDGIVIVDGFHRHRVGKELPAIRESVRNRLPVTRIRAERSDEAARIAATVEHNRARGEHRVEAMSEVVRMLYQAGWRDEKIQEELGMDADEVRRLKQITGLAALFANREFSEAWETT